MGRSLLILVFFCLVGCGHDSKQAELAFAGTSCTTLDWSNDLGNGVIDATDPIVISRSLSGGSFSDIAQSPPGSISYIDCVKMHTKQTVCYRITYYYVGHGDGPFTPPLCWTA